MMEIKLRVAFCVLLLINLGSAEHDDDHTTALSDSKNPVHHLDNVGIPAVPATGSSLDPPNQTAALDLTGTNTSINDASVNVNSSSSSNTSNDGVTAGETDSVAPIIPHLKTTTQPNEDQDASVVLPSLPPFPGNENLSNQSMPEPSIPPSGDHTSASPTPAAPTATASPAHTSHTGPAHTLSTALPSDTPHSDLPHTPPASTPLKTHSPASTLAAEPPGEPHYTKSETLTTTSTQFSPTSNPSSHPEPHNSQPPQATSHSDVDPEVSTVAHSKSTFTPPSSPSAQAKVHVDIPSQLNVGGDATMAHESPTLDPLLAGLVSAFIITAVIITLLLFLKLRRRDNRPEFRRLQDLPMDDMMEDTPLSMYSY